MTVHKFTADIFRVTADNGDTEFFGQVKKQNAKSWTAEIRETDTGDLYRFAGIWTTKKEAVAEVMFIIDSDYRAALLAA